MKVHKILLYLFVCLFVSTPVIAQTMDKNVNGDFIVLMPDGSYEDFDSKNPTHKTLMKDFLKKEKEKKQSEKEREKESKKVESKKKESREVESEKAQLKKEKETEDKMAKKDKDNDKLLKKVQKVFDAEQIKGKLADEAMNKRMKSEYNYKKFLADNPRKKESKEAEKLKKFFDSDKEKEKDAKKDFIAILRDAREARKDLFQAGLDIVNFQEYRLEEPKPVIVIANKTIVSEDEPVENEKDEYKKEEKNKKEKTVKEQKKAKERSEEEVASEEKKENKKKLEKAKKEKVEDKIEEEVSEEELAMAQKKEERENEKKAKKDKKAKEQKEEEKTRKESSAVKQKKEDTKKIEREKEEKTAKIDSKTESTKPTLKLKIEDNVMLNPPFPPCFIEFDGLDEFTKVKRKETRKEVLFKHTDDLMLKFYEKNDFLTCSVSGSRTDKGFKYLTFYFLFNSDNVQNTYGVLEKDFVVTLRFLDGEQMPLFNSKTDRGQVDFLKKTTLYKAVIALTETQDKKLFNGEVDQIRVLWGTGTDDYPVYDLDFFSNLMNCIR